MTVYLHDHEFLRPEDLTVQAVDTATRFHLATNKVEDAPHSNKLPALVDSSHPGKVLDGRTVRVYRLANDKVPIAAPDV